MEMFKDIINKRTLKIAQIRFEGCSRLYSFLTPLNNLKKNDLVLLHTVRGFDKGYFIKYSDKARDRRIASDYVFQKVDIDEYNRLKGD